MVAGEGDTGAVVGEGDTDGRGGRADEQYRRRRGGPCGGLVENEWRGKSREEIR
jgi:hypothetical protein